MIRPEQIRAADELLGEFLTPTPTVESPALSEYLNAAVYLKCEFISPIGSFKARGALFAMLQARCRGALTAAVTSSTGNHGQGVAYAAHRLGVPAHIFLPLNPNPEKLAMIERLGARVVIGGADVDEAKDLARRFAAAEQFTFIDDGESEDVIYGAGTVALELARQAPGLDFCFVPMGSGSLASAIGAGFRLVGADTRIVAVQSEAAPAMVESFRARRPIARPITTLAEGLACRLPARLALDGLLSFVDDAIAVSDEELISCTGLMLRVGHLLVEPAAAAALAGARALAPQIAGKRVALVLTGANVTLPIVQRAITSVAQDDRLAT